MLKTDLCEFHLKFYSQELHLKLLFSARTVLRGFLAITGVSTKFSVFSTNCKCFSLKKEIAVWINSSERLKYFDEDIWCMQVGLGDTF